jgi:hypothetical protein
MLLRNVVFSLRKIIKIFLFIIFILIVLNYNNALKKSSKKPNDYVCSNHNSLVNDKNSLNARNKKIFFFLNHKNSDLLGNLTNIFDSTRIEYIIGFSFIELLELEEISIVIFEFYNDYLKLKDNLEFTNYLLKKKIGVILFNNSANKNKFQIIECQINENYENNDFFHITRKNTQKLKINKILNYDRKFKSLFFNKNFNSRSILGCNDESESVLFVNQLNGIKYVLFGVTDINVIWILKSLFLDSIRFLSDQEIDFSLDRFIQIDIDDIFVAKTGTRMLPDDVDALLMFQDDLTKNYFYHDDNKFKHTIGYSGHYYKSGNDIEDKADELLIGKIFMFF